MAATNIDDLYALAGASEEEREVTRAFFSAMEALTGATMSSDTDDSSDIGSGKPLTVDFKRVEASVDRTVCVWEVTFDGLKFQTNNLEPYCIVVGENHLNTYPITERYTLSSNDRTAARPADVVTTVISAQKSQHGELPMTFAVTTGRHMVTVRRVMPELEGIAKLEYVIIYCANDKHQIFHFSNLPKKTLDLLHDAGFLKYNNEATEAFKVGIFIHSMAAEGMKQLKALQSEVPAEYKIGAEQTLRERAHLDPVQKGSQGSLDSDDKEEDDKEEKEKMVLSPRRHGGRLASGRGLADYNNPNAASQTNQVSGPLEKIKDMVLRPLTRALGRRGGQANGGGVQDSVQDSELQENVSNTDLDVSPLTRASGRRGGQTGGGDAQGSEL